MYLNQFLLQEETGFTIVFAPLSPASVDEVVRDGAARFAGRGLSGAACAEESDERSGGRRLGLPAAADDDEDGDGDDDDDDESVGGMTMKCVDGCGRWQRGRAGGSWRGLSSLRYGSGSGGDVDGAQRGATLLWVEEASREGRR